MSDIREFDTLSDMVKIIEKHYSTKITSPLRFVNQGYDNRINWQSFMICATLADYSNTESPVGYCNCIPLL